MSTKIRNKSFVDLTVCGDSVRIDSTALESTRIEVDMESRLTCETVVAGGVNTYCSKIFNRSDADVRDAVFHSRLGVGEEYVVGTFKVNGKPETPVIEGNELTFRLCELRRNSETEICYQVRVR